MGTLTCKDWPPVNLGLYATYVVTMPKQKPCTRRLSKLVRTSETGKGEIIDLQNLARVLLNLGECKEAREGCLKGLALSKEIGDQGGEASAYSDLGKVYRRLKDFVLLQKSNRNVQTKW